MDRITTEIYDFVKSKLLFNETRAIILQPDYNEKDILPYKTVELLYYCCLNWLVHVSYCVSSDYYSFKAKLTVTQNDLQSPRFKISRITLEDENVFPSNLSYLLY